MRERIRARLREYRTKALLSIVAAVNKTKSKFSGAGRLNSHEYYRSINENNEAGFATYMDRSATFIRQVAPGSSAEYVDELWDGGHKLKQEIMAKIDHDLAVSGNSIGAQLRTDLETTLNKLIERKVEDFELGIMEGKDMNPTTKNTVNIIGSSISGSVCADHSIWERCHLQGDGSKASGINKFRSDQSIARERPIGRSGPSERSYERASGTYHR
jgi:hypothetical protein